VSSLDAVAVVVPSDSTEGSTDIAAYCIESRCRRCEDDTCIAVDLQSTRPPVPERRGSGSGGRDRRYEYGRTSDIEVEKLE